MGVNDHINRTIKRGAIITQVDPSQEIIHARLAGAQDVPVNAFWYEPTFRWPKVGEEWILTEENGSWFLDSIIEPQNRKEQNTTQPEPGDIVLSSGQNRILINHGGKVRLFKEGSAGAGWSEDEFHNLLAGEGTVTGIAGVGETLGVQLNVIAGHFATQEGKEIKGSVIIGEEAGKKISDSLENVLIGPQAGSGSKLRGTLSKSGSQNIGIGYFVWGEAIQAEQSIALGVEAGLNSVENQEVYLYGVLAGFRMKECREFIAIGTEAGLESRQCNQVVAVGTEAVIETINCREIIGIGTLAASKCTNECLELFAFGTEALLGCNASTSMIGIGTVAGEGAFKCRNIIAIGPAAGRAIERCEELIAIGLEAGAVSKKVERGIYIGDYTGAHSEGEDNIYFGAGVGVRNKGETVKLRIGHHTEAEILKNINEEIPYTQTDLIVGDFGAETVLVNGTIESRESGRTEEGKGPFVIAAPGVTATNPILLSWEGAGAETLYISSRTPGVGFTASTGGAGTGRVNWKVGG